jgi:hypothetical protein
MDSELIRWKWLWGIPNPLWIIHEDYIGKLVERLNLKPLIDVARYRELEIEDYVGQHGGMRGPHLHYRGNLYRLNKEQWSQFTGKIIQEFSNKLAQAKEVSFEQFVELADTMNGIL